jgi:Zn-dependent membrane protease YugP
VRVFPLAANGSGWGLYFLFLIPPLVIGLAVQAWLRKTTAQNAQVPVASGLTGADVAARILSANGLSNVEVGRAQGGALSDNYDPRKHALFLSEEIYDGRSITSTAVAAHEVGHAIQHAQGYKALAFRTAMYPAVAFASQAWFFLLLIGFFAQAFGLVQLAIVLYAVVVVFQLVTLPVEFNASKRAAVQLSQLGLVTQGERQGVKSVLTAAGLTYVAAALAALTQLAYYLLVFGRRS